MTTKADFKRGHHTGYRGKQGSRRRNQKGGCETDTEKIVLTTFLVLLIGIPIGLFLVGRRVPDCWYPNLSVHASNVPDGTCYLDLLLQIDENDAYYTDYHEDGYVSMSVHYLPLRAVQKGENVNTDFVFRDYSEVDGGGSRETIYSSYEQYGKFKPAYVSQDGEVLDVTRKSSLLKDDGDEEMFANRKKPKQQPEP